MSTKYELTDETKKINGVTLHRIRALRDIPGAGVKSGDLGGWIEKESNLSKYGDAWVYDDAWVYGNAQVYDNARVYGNALVCDDAQVYDNARVCGGNAWVCDNARVYGNAWVCDDARVCGNARVCDDARVYGNALIYGNALVCDNADYMTFRNTWSSGRWFTYTRSNKMWKVGCFYGSGDELIKKAYADSELSGKCYEAIVRTVETIDKAIEEAKETT